MVTANYKMTFDAVRNELNGLSVWLLVLDTRGINVWCAAGKGTFGTEELVRRIADTGLRDMVDHREILLPQLGAPGVSAHEVCKLSSFKVTYGPVKASDIKPFLQAGKVATREMRTVDFSTMDRAVLIPVELGVVARYLVALVVLSALLHVVNVSGLWLKLTIGAIGAVLCGVVLFPLLLPYLPGRAFALKGWLLGVAYALAIEVLAPAGSLWGTVGYLFLLPPITAFLAMNFTGSSTFTSLSGVEREVKVTVPVTISSVALGVICLILNAVL